MAVVRETGVVGVKACSWSRAMRERGRAATRPLTSTENLNMMRGNKAQTCSAISARDLIHTSMIPLFTDEPSSDFSPQDIQKTTALRVQRAFFERPVRVLVKIESSRMKLSWKQRRRAVCNETKLDWKLGIRGFTLDVSDSRGKPMPQNPVERTRTDCSAKKKERKSKSDGPSSN
ncbi:hypothetical protein L218DRAFT_947816 [Marasmius fiardii PR-910]|nr:hypothetical protein L218DRAFT_947816 [Marasmius fiardii PR-910]